MVEHIAVDRQIVIGADALLPIRRFHRDVVILARFHQQVLDRAGGDAALRSIHRDRLHRLELAVRIHTVDRQLHLLRNSAHREGIAARIRERQLLEVYRVAVADPLVRQQRSRAQRAVCVAGDRRDALALDLIIAVVREVVLRMVEHIPAHIQLIVRADSLLPIRRFHRDIIGGAGQHQKIFDRTGSNAVLRSHRDRLHRLELAIRVHAVDRQLRFLRKPAHRKGVAARIRERQFLPVRRITVTNPLVRKNRRGAESAVRIARDGKHRQRPRLIEAVVRQTVLVMVEHLAADRNLIINACALLGVSGFDRDIIIGVRLKQQVFDRAGAEIDGDRLQRFLLAVRIHTVDRQLHLAGKPARRESVAAGVLEHQFLIVDRVAVTDPLLLQHLGGGQRAVGIAAKLHARQRFGLIDRVVRDAVLGVVEHGSVHLDAVIGVFPLVAAGCADRDVVGSRFHQEVAGGTGGSGPGTGPGVVFRLHGDRFELRLAVSLVDGQRHAVRQSAVRAARIGDREAVVAGLRKHQFAVVGGVAEADPVGFDQRFADLVSLLAGNRINPAVVSRIVLRQRPGVVRVVRIQLLVVDLHLIVHQRIGLLRAYFDIESLPHSRQQAHREALGTIGHRVVADHFAAGIQLLDRDAAAVVVHRLHIADRNRQFECAVNPEHQAIGRIRTQTDSLIAAVIIPAAVDKPRIVDSSGIVSIGNRKFQSIAPFSLIVFLVDRGDPELIFTVSKFQQPFRSFDDQSLPHILALPGNPILQDIMFDAAVLFAAVTGICGFIPGEKRRILRLNGFQAVPDAIPVRRGSIHLEFCGGTGYLPSHAVHSDDFPRKCAIRP